MRMSMDEEPVQTTWPCMAMSSSMASLLLSWMASTDAVTSIGGRVSALPSSLRHNMLINCSEACLFLTVHCFVLVRLLHVCLWGITLPLSLLTQS